MTSRFDIIIVGGGMVGLTMAAALAESDLSVAVLEKGSFDELTSGDWLVDSHCAANDYQIRVSAISPGNQRFLSNLGIWQNIPLQRKADYEQMKVWDADGDGSIVFDAAEIASPFLGSIVENQVLRAAALRRLQTCPNIEFLESQSVSEIETLADNVSVELVSGQQLSARLLIGADGALSAVRQQLGISSQDQAYGQTAFVANIQTELNHDNTAWQRFTRNGPVAFLPLPKSNLCSIVWSIDSNKAEELQSLDEQLFAIKLGHAFEHRLGQVTAVSKVASFPLVKRHSERYLTERCVLVGDAAHTIHPLAGQGVNLGFQDVACLSLLIAELTKNQRDWSLMANLRPYERERKAENALMQNAMSGFKWLFGHTAMAPTLIRNTALNLADKSGPIKQEIIRRAMGL